jgi:hypothetical protein
MLVMLLGIGLFTIGCTQEESPAPASSGTPAAEAAADNAGGEAAGEKAEGEGEKAAETKEESAAK